MLDTETKRRIDTARDILVGKVPNPASQVEQITIALIYKFMDDMDKEVEELGGKPSFFRGDYAKYSWSKIFDPKLSGFEIVALYGDALDNMNLNPDIPPLFREIFKNAFLPYRDPETLKSFLKIINEFHYTHSEKLGDAYEYLLSIMSSQGDAGQFRTPRHIIDFIVEVVNPRKSDKILDPACGTAGFLISSYKHILKSNTKKSKGDLLTPEDKNKLTENLTGYDISPDMVRISLVNMYLHGFSNPKIFEYDSLTSEDRWNEYYDVVLANPPFMSPKGGIRPHKRFSIQAKRSEVLFVDYIAEHLTPSGKAGVIVPEGIIFQSGSAYKNLRKMLVENYLWAVVSLPAGIFNPYSGVKTSILLLDKALAKSNGNILFVKVENDGYDLGAQRRKIDKDNLPAAKVLLKEYIKGKTDDTNHKDINYLIVPKQKISENGDYNLSMDRYKENEEKTHTIFEQVRMGVIADVISGQSPESKYYNKERNGMPFYQGKTDFGEIYIGEPQVWTNKVIKKALKDDILISVRAPVGTVNISTQDICIGRGLAAIRPNKKIIRLFLFYYLRSIEDKICGNGGAVFDSINREQLLNLKIPLPPLEIQQKIVNKIESYQKIIDGAKQIIENYKPEIDINPDWEIRKLSEVCSKITDGTHRRPIYQEKGIPFLRVTDITESNSSKKYITKDEHLELIKRCKPEKNDILYTKNGTIGIAKLIDWNWEFSIFVSLCLLKPKKELMNPKYLEIFLNSDIAFLQATAHSKSGTITNLHLVEIKQFQIPLPPLQVQQQIVDRIESEQKLIDANKELVKIYEQKIKDEINKVWEE